MRTLTPTQVRRIAGLTSTHTLDCPSVELKESDHYQAIVVVWCDNWVALTNGGHGVGAGLYREPVAMYSVTRRGKIRDLWEGLR